jgi:hypothetical protein
MNLQEKSACVRAVNGCDRIYNMAANMGGMIFIELHKKPNLHGNHPSLSKPASRRLTLGSLTD